MTTATAPRLPFGLGCRLSLMMFLQYAIWGAWLPFLWSFLEGHRGMDGDQIGWMFAAGAVGAIEAGCHRVVTVAMNKVEFHHPVFVGDLVSLYTELEHTGRSSVVIHVDVRARRQRGTGEEVSVTEATVTYVNIDEAGKPTPIAS